MPSFYWHRNCYATFMDDPLALRLVDVIGADRIMWSIDYPHPESVYGYTGDITRQIYETLGHDNAKLVLGGTAAKLYNL